MAWLGGDQTGRYCSVCGEHAPEPKFAKGQAFHYECMICVACGKQIEGANDLWLRLGKVYCTEHRTTKVEAIAPNKPEACKEKCSVCGATTSSLRTLYKVGGISYCDLHKPLPGPAPAKYKSTRLTQKEVPEILRNSAGRRRMEERGGKGRGMGAKKVGEPGERSYRQKDKPKREPDPEPEPEPDVQSDEGEDMDEGEESGDEADVPAADDRWFEEAELHSGWMVKRGKRFKTWRKRYFVLIAGRIVYVKDPSIHKAKGIVRLAEGSTIEDMDAGMAKKRAKMFGFVVRTPERVWYFFTEQEGERDDWKERIGSQIPGYVPPAKTEEQFKPKTGRAPSPARSAGSRKSSKSNKSTGSRKSNKSNKSNKSGSVAPASTRRKISSSKRGRRSKTRPASSNAITKSS